MTTGRMARWILFGWLMVQASSVWSLGFSGVDLEGRPCKGEPQGYGPFDYTNPKDVQNHLGVVQTYHFTPEVERLQRGKSGSLLSDLDYVLRAFPNHHRALYALIRFTTDPATKDKRGSEIGHLYSQPECYLQRALVFRPNDGRVEMLYGIYLHKLGKLADAEKHYRRATELMPQNSEAWYNLGLLLTDEKKFAEAVPVAEKAYAYGYPLDGLRRRLAAAGHPLNE